MLTISIKGTYAPNENNADDEDSTSHNDNNPPEYMLCKFKLIYGNDRKNVHVKLGTIVPNDDFTKKTTKTKNEKKRAVLDAGLSAAMSSVNVTNVMSAIEQQGFMSSILAERRSSCSLYKKLVYKFKGRSFLELGDYLEIYCYKTNKSINR